MSKWIGRWNLMLRYCIPQFLKYCVMRSGTRHRLMSDQSDKMKIIHSFRVGNEQPPPLQYRLCAAGQRKPQNFHRFKVLIKGIFNQKLSYYYNNVYLSLSISFLSSFCLYFQYIHLSFTYFFTLKKYKSTNVKRKFIRCPIMLIYNLSIPLLPNDD